MTDIEVGRFALRTFSLHWDWQSEYGSVRVGRYGDYHYGFDDDSLFDYPHSVLGPIANNKTCVAGSWRGGICEAQCFRGEYGISRMGARKGAVLPAPPLHTAPHKACTCGIYGALDFKCLYQQFAYETQQIAAVIAAEGQTVIGTRGLRTQYARVVGYVAGNAAYDRVAKKQFSDAKRWENVGDMLDTFHIPVDTGAAGVVNRPGGYRWWT